MKLIKPTMQYDEQIQDFRREYLESGESMDGGASLRKFENTKDWLDFNIDRDPTAAEMEKAMDDKPLEETGLQVNPTWKCGLCLSYCPVGNWKDHFGDVSEGPSKRAY